MLKLILPLLLVVNTAHAERFGRWGGYVVVVVPSAPAAATYRTQNNSGTTYGTTNNYGDAYQTINNYGNSHTTVNNYGTGRTTVNDYGDSQTTVNSRPAVVNTAADSCHPVVLENRTNQTVRVIVAYHTSAGWQWGDVNMEPWGKRSLSTDTSTYYTWWKADTGYEWVGYTSVPYGSYTLPMYAHVIQGGCGTSHTAWVD